MIKHQKSQAIDGGYILTRDGREVAFAEKEGRNFKATTLNQTVFVDSTMRNLKELVKIHLELEAATLLCAASGLSVLKR